eukprot:12718706-Heterocapsa_arctica.AAC.1
MTRPMRLYSMMPPSAKVSLHSCMNIWQRATRPPPHCARQKAMTQTTVLGPTSGQSSNFACLKVSV